MKSLLTLTLSLIVTLSTFSQNYITQAKLPKEKEWGYINLDGKFIIDPQYRQCFPFSDGFAPIVDKKTTYFIDLKGKKLETEIDNFVLFNVVGTGDKGFSDGMASVAVDHKWGYMNTKGELVVQLKYNKAYPFNDGFAIAFLEGGHFFVIDTNGVETEIIGATACKKFTEGLAPFKNSEGLYGYIGTDAKVAIKPQFRRVGYFIDGIAWAKSMDDKFGFINQSGEWIIKAQFKKVGYFNGGLAWARTMDNKIGYINIDGEWEIEPKYIAAKGFDEISGIAMAKLETGWIYIKENGETLTIKPKLEVIKPFKNGLAKGVLNDKIGYFDNTGDWVIEPKYDGVRAFVNGYAAAKIGNKWGFIDMKGNWVIEPIFGGVKNFAIAE